ncbi:MAG: DinB family protein [bacterium]|nr:DinB family protein [bacterium]
MIWRDCDLLVAWLAAERGRLLRELLGIDERALTTVPVFSNWTATNLLAHIGDYDRVFAERIELVLNGNPERIEPIDDLDVNNVPLHERIRHWSLEASVDYLEGMRRKFLSALEYFPDEDLDRDIPVSWGTARVRTWIEWRHKHDFGHADDLRAWREKYAYDGWNGPKAILLATIRAARADLLATMTLVPKAERETRLVCGEWTLKDVAGHMADWTTYFLGCVAIMQGENPPDGWEQPEDEADAYNARRQAARRDQPWIQVWAEFNARYSTLRECLEKLTDEQINQQQVTTPYASIYECAWSSLEHDLDHAAVIRAALQLEMPSRLLTFSGPFT